MKLQESETAVYFVEWIRWVEKYRTIANCFWHLKRRIEFKFVDYARVVRIMVILSH